ncbi:MAG: Nif11-like leader peptide family RiPP precursor [Holophagales bacterium]|nr:Nif11-like leader peptide family RiPP precursor [Holophagales bacterium]
MSFQEVGRFARDVQNNQPLLDQLASGELGLDGMVETARNMGYSFTAEEAKSFAKSQQQETLSETDLERVAGGKSDGDVSEGSYIVVQPVVVTVALLVLP